MVVVVASSLATTIWLLCFQASRGPKDNPPVLISV